MNDKCKYCDYVSKCSRICEYDSYLCKVHRSFPKVVDKSYEQLQLENKILKENAENNDKVVDKVNWENQLLKKENKQLKKEIQEYQKELEKADSITQSCIFQGYKESEISFRNCLNKMTEYKTKIDRAINYIEKESAFLSDDEYELFNKKELKDILKGEK